MRQSLKRREPGAIGGALLSGAVAWALATGPAQAEAADAAAAEAAVSLDTVIVTGVRGVSRTVADSPAPIDVVGARDLQSSGRAELGEALAKLLPSFNFGTNQAGVNSISRPVTNRGLGPAYTLVLVNGKRRHNGSILTNGGGDTSGVNPVDFDLIPSSLVSRIEVLKDSAAAQYGTDAVAGVVNIQLKSGAHGGHVAATTGSLYSAHGDPWTYKAEGDFGLPLGDGGFIHFSADAKQRGMAWWNRPATNTIIYAPASNPKNAAWNRDGAHNGDPQIKALNLAYNAELPLSSGVTLYSFSTLGLRKAVIGNNFRRPGAAGELASFAALFPDGYYPLNNTRERDLQVVGGARGAWAGWSWDLSSSYGRNRNHQYSELSIKPDLGPTSPTKWPNLATFQFEQWTQNLDVTRPFDVGLAKPLQVSAGLEYRTDKFSTFAGDPLAYTISSYVIRPGDQEGDANVGKLAANGVQAAVVLSPDDEVRLTRGVIAAYLDLGLNPIEPWYVGLAARGEHYDDGSGDAWSGKFNSRYDLTSNFAVRGTFGTGFRAPSLSQIGYAQTDNRTALIGGVITPSLSKVARTTSALARALGASDLRPEKSWNAGLGFVWRPTPAINVTLDAYHVRIKDRIQRTGLLFGPSVTPILLQFGLTGTEKLQYFTNAVDTRTDGLDLVADTTRDLGDWGSVTLTAAFNYNRTKVTHVADTPAVLSNLDTAGGSSFFGHDRIGDLTALNPKTKLILSGRWRRGPVAVSLQTTRYGDYSLYQNAPAPDVRYGAQWITDLDVAYQLTENLTVSAGANNLFSVRTDTVSDTAPFAPKTGTGYYGPAPYAPSGGFWYGRISYDF